MALDGIRLIETRILVRRENGWAALPYVWNEEQTDATLKRAGAVVPMTLYRPDGGGEDFAYLVPDAKHQTEFFFQFMLERAPARDLRNG